MIIDLHGYSIPIAKGAVRSALNLLKREAAVEVEALRLSGKPDSFQIPFGGRESISMSTFTAF